MLFQPILVLGLALTALASPLPKKKKPSKNPPQVITLDLDDGEKHFPDGTTELADGTTIQPNGRLPPKIALYPDGRVCETQPPTENVMFDNREWVEFCAPRMYPFLFSLFLGRFVATISIT